MTDEQICPFMSRPDNYEIRLLASTPEEFQRSKEAVKDIPFIPCKKERCAAWGKMHVIDYDNPDEDAPCIIVEGCRLIP